MDFLQVFGWYGLGLYVFFFAVLWTIVGRKAIVANKATIINGKYIAIAAISIVPIILISAIAIYGTSKEVMIGYSEYLNDLIWMIVGFIFFIYLFLSSMSFLGYKIYCSHVVHLSSIIMETLDEINIKYKFSDEDKIIYKLIYNYTHIFKLEDTNSQITFYLNYFGNGIIRFKNMDKSIINTIMQNIKNYEDPLFFLKKAGIKNLILGIIVLVLSVFYLFLPTINQFELWDKLGL